MSGRGHQRTLARQEAQEAATIHASVSGQNLGCIFVMVCAVVVGLAILALLAVKPMSPEEVNQSIEQGKQAVNKGRGAPLTFLFPEETRRCAYAGECYSWGDSWIGKPQPWHKTCIAPILVLVAIVTFLYTIARLLKGR